MLNQIFISDAMAQASSAAANPEFSFASFVPLLAIFAIFYFLIVRPQSKKMKEHQIMVNNLKIGNKVVTNGGIFGTVRAFDSKEDTIEIEISEGVTIKILKTYVATLVKKENSKEDKKELKKNNKKTKK